MLTTFSHIPDSDSDSDSDSDDEERRRWRRTLAVLPLAYLFVYRVFSHLSCLIEAYDEYMDTLAPREGEARYRLAVSLAQGLLAGEHGGLPQDVPPDLFPVGTLIRLLLHLFARGNQIGGGEEGPILAREARLLTQHPDSYACLVASSLTRKEEEAPMPEHEKKSEVPSYDEKSQPAAHTRTPQTTGEDRNSGPVSTLPPDERKWVYHYRQSEQRRGEGARRGGVGGGVGGSGPRTNRGGSSPGRVGRQWGDHHVPL